MFIAAVTKGHKPPPVPATMLAAKACPSTLSRTRHAVAHLTPGAAETLDRPAHRRLREVAAGNGDLSLAAAWHCCETLGAEYPPERTDRRRTRLAEPVKRGFTMKPLIRIACAALSVSLIPPAHANKAIPQHIASRPTGAGG